MPTKLQKAWVLPCADCFLLLKVSIFLAIIQILIKLFPLKIVLRLLSRPQAFPGDPAFRPYRTVNLVELTSRYHVPRPTCLEKALVLYSLLRSRGIAAELTIGTAKKSGAFKAHAWVELHGQVIMGSSAEPYAPLLTVLPQGIK